MRKGFTRRPKPDEPATQVKNYIKPSGLQRLKDEHQFLLTRERPAVVEVVAWAAGNGDRSENADYQYGKRRLRQIGGIQRPTRRCSLNRQMRGDEADKLSRCDDLGIFPESWEVPLVAGNQVVRAGRVRALQKLVIFWIARDFQLVSRVNHLYPVSH